MQDQIEELENQKKRSLQSSNAKQTADSNFPGGTQLERDKLQSEMIQSNLGRKTVGYGFSQ